MDRTAGRSLEWLLKTGAVIEDYLDLTASTRFPPPATIERRDFWNRPPLGPPLAGRRATSGGRGHRVSQSDHAKARRRALAWEAYQMRLEGYSIRAIAEALGVGKTTVGRWLYGVYPEAGALLSGMTPSRHVPLTGGVRFLFSPVETHEIPCLGQDWPTRWGG